MTEIPGMVERVARTICCPSGQCGVRDPKRWKGGGGPPCQALIYYEDEAHAVIAAHEAALRDAGMVIVPVEPTEEMQFAGASENIGFARTADGDGRCLTPSHIWRAMVAAAHRCSTTNPESKSAIGDAEGEP